MLIKIRLFILAALWISVGLNSPFIIHFFKSFLFVLIEYGIYFERRINQIIKDLSSRFKFGFSFDVIQPIIKYQNFQ